MIKGCVKTINVTTDDLELIDFMLSHNEKVIKVVPDSDMRVHMAQLHLNLRQTLQDAK